MNVSIHPTPDTASATAADLLAGWLIEPGTRHVMLAAGNSPLLLYNYVAGRKLPLSHVHLYALDEYVGVPPDEPRNCANLLRRTAAEPWGLPPEHFHGVSSLESSALDSVRQMEQRLANAGGLDVIVLGLGQNGHLGFNEPGSAVDSAGRVLALDEISIAANRGWFDGDYAPSRGATTGLKTILSARRVMILAFGAHKAAAVHAMRHGPRTEQCPASLLQGHADTHVFLDEASSSTFECRNSDSTVRPADSRHWNVELRSTP